MIIVHDPNYKNIILNTFQSERKPPKMIVEFYGRSGIIYTTTYIKGLHNPELKTVQLYALNPTPTDDCSKVVWKDMNHNIKYEVVYSPYLTKHSIQVSHIVISYDENEPYNMQYLEIPSDVLNQTVENEGPKIINYYLNNIITVPENRLFGEIEYDINKNEFYGFVKVFLNGIKAKIRRVNETYNIEFET